MILQSPFLFLFYELQSFMSKGKRVLQNQSCISMGALKYLLQNTNFFNPTALNLQVLSLCSPKTQIFLPKGFFSVRVK